jgi:hypothetical protein
LATTRSSSAAARAARAAGLASTGDVLDRLVDPNAAHAPGDAQQAAVVHAVEQVRRRQPGAAPGVDAAAVREVGLDVARMRWAVRADELEHVGRFPFRRRRPRLRHRARMHQREMPSRQEAVVDEGVFLDLQLRVAALEVAGAVAGDAVAQDQVLRARRRADRVGLDEAELVDRATERRRLEQRSRDGVAAQVVERRCLGHAAMMPKRGARRRARGRDASLHWRMEIEHRTQILSRLTLHVAACGAATRWSCCTAGRRRGTSGAR